MGWEIKIWIFCKKWEGMESRNKLGEEVARRSSNVTLRKGDHLRDH